MDPVTSGTYEYPHGHVSYFNELGQTVSPFTGSLPVNEGGLIRLRLFFFPSGELTAVARSAAFYAGDVPGLPDTPPDFADGDEVVAADMASVDSPFEPTQATLIEPQSL